MAKARSSRSPLANPKTLIHKFAAEIQEHLHMPDPSPFYVVLGALAGNMMTGPNIWLMLVGPGGIGKGRPIDAISDIDRVFVIGAIEGKAGLMSGASNKDKAKDASGGLLFQIGSRGLIAPKDFTSTLSQSHDKLTDAIGSLREIADGEWSRPLGSDGGRLLRWRGNVGFIGACTPKLDQFHKVIGELGQRWMVYRFPETDGFHETFKALSIPDKMDSMKTLRQKTKEFVENLSLEWSCYPDCKDDEWDGDHKHGPGPYKRELSQKEKNRLIALARFAARARSIVPRDDKNPNEITASPEFEPSTRLGEGLGQLFLGLEVIGLPEGECWQLVTKVAWDSIMPRMRADLLFLLKGGPGGEKVKLTFGECQSVLKVSGNTVRRVLEDLKILGLTERTGYKRGEESMVGLSSWARDELGRCQ